MKLWWKGLLNSTLVCLKYTGITKILNAVLYLILTIVLKVIFYYSHFIEENKFDNLLKITHLIRATDGELRDFCFNVHFFIHKHPPLLPRYLVNEGSEPQSCTVGVWEPAHSCPLQSQYWTLYASKYAHLPKSGLPESPRGHGMSSTFLLDNYHFKTVHLGLGKFPILKPAQDDLGTCGGEEKLESKQ